LFISSIQKRFFLVSEIETAVSCSKGVLDCKIIS